MRELNKYSGPVFEALLELGFSEEESYAAAVCVGTEYTSMRMLRYLESSQTVGIHSFEELADEMLIILQERDIYQKKAIEKKRGTKRVEDKFLRGISIDWSSENLLGSYAADIPALRDLERLVFNQNICFFCGENGSGKSTLLEAIAIALGLNPEGGTHNYGFSTYDDYSPLHSAVRLRRGVCRPEWMYFLRAESFYNVASVTNTQYNDDGALPDYHARSHGESFMDFIYGHRSVGLYLLDEPEAALSPQRQLELLVLLVKMSREGSQFIIATHSPILLGTPGAEIYSFDGGVHSARYEETGSYQLMNLFMNNREKFLRDLLADV